MDTKTLCQALLNEACEDNVAFYRRMIDERPLDAAKDEHWRSVIELARALPAEQREVLLAFARQAAIDALSTFCGAIDGSSSLDGRFVALSLVDDEGEQHAGRLQETFLALAQR